MLKPGGYLFIRTPNLFSYFGLFSRLVPNRLHAGALAKIKAERKDDDVFPAYYNCNTVWKMRKMLRGHGFASCVYGYEAEPQYFHFSRLLYFLAVLHQRYSPRIIKPAIFAFGKKVAREGVRGQATDGRA